MIEEHFQIGIKALIRNKAGEILLVHLRGWKQYLPCWDLPGGRMNPKETFLETLKREMIEEIGVGYQGKPKQLAAIHSNITIGVGDRQLPLVLIVYEVKIADSKDIKLDPNSAEDDFGWFAPSEAADKLAQKFSAEFCEIIRKL